MKTGKKFSLAAIVLALSLSLSSLPSTVLAAQAQSVSVSQTRAKASSAGKKTKKGLVKEKGKYYYYVNGKKIKNQWKDIQVAAGKIRRYHFGKNGAACTGSYQENGYVYVFNSAGMLRASSSNKIFTVGKYQYCPNQNGQCQTGWLLSGDKLVYGRKNGRLVKDGVVSGITIQGGQAIMNPSGKCRYYCLKTLNSITNASMTNAQKLSACWSYMVGSSFSYVLRYDPDFSDPNWAKIKAYEMLQTHGGDCVSFACAFAGLAAAIGYKPQVIYGRVPGSRDNAADGYTRHAWVRIGGLYYDPEAQFAGWLTGVYGMTYYPISYQVLRVVDFETGRGL